MLNRFIETREELVRKKEKALILSKLLLNNLVPSLKVIKDIPYTIRTIRALKNGEPVDLREFLSRVDETYNQSIEVAGVENIPTDGKGFLIAIPHMLTFNPEDPNPLWFLSTAAKYLPKDKALHIVTWCPSVKGSNALNNNFYTRTVKQLGGHPIVPRNIEVNASSVMATTKEIRTGDIGLIAPEGGQNFLPDGTPTLGLGRKGVGNIALEADCPVLPIVFWEDEVKQRHLHFLNPIYTDKAEYNSLSLENKLDAQQLVAHTVMMSIAQSLPEEYNKGSYS